MLSFVAISSLLIYFSSCKNEDKKSPETFAGSCAVLTSTNLQDSWVNPGYTKPGDPSEVDTIDILASYDDISTEFKIYVLGLKKGGGGPLKGSEIKIFEGTSCQPPAIASFPRHNYFKIANLGILDNDGKLKKFKYVAFTPTLYPKDTNIMAFDLSVFYNDGTSESKGVSLPCPPCYNCKPVPENCQMEPTDSTDN